MSKIAFLFPGQGTQYVGMGKDFYEQYDCAREIFELAGEVTGLNLPQLCFEENDRLGITEYTQVALLTTQVAMLEVIRQMGIKADYAAGLSLGEYGALAAADVMKKEDLFRLIRKRGIYMQEAYPVGGAMMAILGLDAESIRRTLAQVDGIVSIANDNCPGQLVITGQETAVEEAGRLLTEQGARRCIPLKVSGPFHSALLEHAGKQLAEDLQSVELHTPSIPYISNVTADLVDSADPVKELLERQVFSPVRFRESILKLIELGVDYFIEIGPGKTLTGFVKKTDRNCKIINIQSTADLEQLEALLHR